jgi:superkiller protein 3
MADDRPQSGQFLDLASTLMDKSKFSEAIEALERAQEIEPNNRTVLDRVIICNLELKKPKKAIEAMNSILNLEPTAYKVWADKAYLHFLLKEDNEGINALRESLKLNPRNQREWYLLGTVLMTVEQWDEARESLLKSIQLDPNSAITWYNLAVCNYMMGDFPGALGAADYAITLDPILENLADEWLGLLSDDQELIEQSLIAFETDMYSAGG